MSDVKCTYFCLQVGSWLLVVVLGGQIVLSIYRLHFYNTLVDDDDDDDDEDFTSYSSSYDEDGNPLIHSDRSNFKGHLSQRSDAAVVRDGNPDMGFQNKFYRESKQSGVALDDILEEELERLSRQCSREDICSSTPIKVIHPSNDSPNRTRRTGAGSVVYVSNDHVQPDEINLSHIEPADGANTNNNANVYHVEYDEEDSIRSNVKLIQTDV